MMLAVPPPCPMSPALASRLHRLRHLALDLDGTLYRGGTVFPWSRPFLDRLRTLGVGFTMLTNNPSKSPADYLAHLQRYGLEIHPDQLYTSGQATLDWLRSARPDFRRLFLLGTPSMQTQFAEAGYALTDDDPEDPPDAVIVGFDPTLTYPRLGRAAWWIQKGKPFLATNPDAVCPTDLPTILIDCGSLCALLQKATGRAPERVFGKPDPTMLDGIRARHGLGSEEIGMVGDRLYTDMQMALRAGAVGVLVLTGEATAEDAAKADPPPDVVLPSVAELGDLLERAQASRPSSART